MSVPGEDRRALRNVLFLCTGNSARSIIAEATLRQFGAGRFNAYSAGSHPTGEVHAGALAVLREQGIATGGLRSKSWDEFAAPDAPRMDFIITVCDNAAGEACPVWPGQPVTAHWGVPDPASVRGTDAERRATFLEVAQILIRRTRRLVELPLDKLDRVSLQRHMRDIGCEDSVR
jgi:arsenate reductase